MRFAVRVAGLIALALVIALADAKRPNDQPWFTPPPESVAEQFLKAVVNKRFARAHAYLDSELQQKVRPAELRTYLETLGTSFGDIANIEGQYRSIEGDDAMGEVAIESDRGRASLRFALTRESELWKIASLPLG